MKKLQTIDTALQVYRKRPGLDPALALTWFSAHITVTAKSDSYTAIASFLSGVMSIDTSAWIGKVRVPGPGWRPATEPATSLDQLMRTMTINQYNSEDGQVIFDFDIQARFIPLATRAVARSIRQQVFIPSDYDVSYITSLYVFDYPAALWEELTGPPAVKAEDEPVPIKAADWGATDACA
ncbi:hypothetical protein OAK65_03775 [Synechococcus sp. AH-551-N17]|nr:hypothetical protein [Synechococcus sp. AH-551-N17]